MDLKRRKVWFVSDVHLGLRFSDPQEREKRFVDFLKTLNSDNASALYLLGDIWDFWYEYKYVVPREGARVVAQFIRLMDEGVDVYFFEGNHDIWTFSFFESLGMKKLRQPYIATIGGKTFCLGHGDALGGAKWSYSLMLKIFHCRFLQRCFSTVHPFLAFRLGLGWSNSNRRSHKPYHFAGETEPLYRFCREFARTNKVDFYVFGHFHDRVDMPLPFGGRLIIVDSWMGGGTPHAVFDGESVISSF